MTVGWARSLRRRRLLRRRAVYFQTIRVAILPPSEPESLRLRSRSSVRSEPAIKTSERRRTLNGSTGCCNSLPERSSIKKWPPCCWKRPALSIGTSSGYPRLKSLTEKGRVRRCMWLSSARVCLGWARRLNSRELESGSPFWRKMQRLGALGMKTDILIVVLIPRITFTPIRFIVTPNGRVTFRNVMSCIRILNNALTNLACENTFDSIARLPKCVLTQPVSAGT